MCQEPITRPSRAIFVTRSTACALKGESFDWQKFSQESISGLSDTVAGAESCDFSYTLCSSKRSVRAASLDSGSWSLSWDAATWISLSMPYSLIPSTPCWHQYNTRHMGNKKMPMFSNNWLNNRREARGS